MSKCEQCIVREFSALKSLTKEELLKMATCRTSMTIRKGESIFDEGQRTNGVFCVRQGICKMTKRAENGKQQIVRLAKKGELLGQRSIIGDEPANLSAVALEDMEVCFIPRADIIGFFNENSKFSLNMMQSLCHGLKEADDELVNMAQQSVRERLAKTLLYLEKEFGVDNELAINVHLTRDEIANLVGTATESCIRLLSEFKTLGLIKLTGKKIIIKDREALQHVH